MSDRYAVFGNPIAQSKSPFIHGEFARQFGEDMTYEAIEAPLDEFVSSVASFIALDGRGINVTAPFKTEAYDLADERREAAEICGAANCLKFEGGRVVAENFDGVGLVRDIEENLGVALVGKRVLMAGAGGATRGAVVPFLEAGVANLVIANRTVAKAEAIRNLLGSRGPITACGYDEIKGGFDVVMNSTSASLSGGLPPVPGTAFAGCELAYDLAYGKGKTPFLALAETSGVGRIVDGVGMLVEQAAEAFSWWRGKRPVTTLIIEKLTIPLE